MTDGALLFIFFEVRCSNIIYQYHGKFPHSPYLPAESLPETNALAYFALLSVTKKKKSFSKSEPKKKKISIYSHFRTPNFSRFQRNFFVRQKWSKCLSFCHSVTSVLIKLKKGIKILNHKSSRIYFLKYFLVENSTKILSLSLTRILLS